MKRFNQSYNKSDIERYFALLSKEIKKQYGKKYKVELVIVGGASILLNYDFRENTMDIDAFISTGSSIKAAIYKIADDNNISTEWLNNSFLKTTSFSNKLIEVSKFYKTYNQVLDVRTISDEYLIAMKLEAFRKYKYDLSDIVNVLYSMEGKREENVEKIKKAYNYLYSKDIEGDRLKYLKKITDSNIDIKDLRKYEEINLNIIKSERSKEVKKDNLDDVLMSIDKIVE